MTVDDTTVTVTECHDRTQPDLRILHFNDVYHVDGGSREPVGGVARFQTLCNFYSKDASFHGHPELLTFFSGDAFNPSLESSVTKGSHMVPVLNNIGTNAACVGVNILLQNHDLDFGLPHYKKLTGQCNFPWLLSNIFEPDGQTILANSPPTHLITSSNGIKIGLIGIAEQEWISTVNALPENLPFVSSSQSVIKYAAQLRTQGAEMIIALCHQREVNDRRLANEIPAGTLDIILAGHDHDYRYIKLNSCHIVCSGSDFKQLSYIEAFRNTPSSPTKWCFNILRRDITSALQPDAPTEALMSTLFSSMRAHLQKPIGYTSTALDARFSTIRTRESNYANLLADLIRHHYSADCAIIVGGTLRGDQVYPPGVIRLKDILDCFPFEDPNVCIRTTGAAIWSALENGVSKYPALEGRFPQVSGMVYEFDARRPPGERLVRVTIGGEPLVREKSYTCATRGYTVSGGDGFDSLRLKENGGESEWVVDEENGQITSTLVRQYFMSLKVLGRWKNWSNPLDKHWSEVVEKVHSAHPLRTPGTSRRQSCSVRSGSGDGLLAVNNANPAPAVTLNGAIPGGTDIRNTEGEADDSESDAEDIPALPRDPIAKERELKLIRKTARKWRRLAGLKGDAGICDGDDDDDDVAGVEEGVCAVDWTHGIEAKIEGRIVILGGVEHS